MEAVAHFLQMEAISRHRSGEDCDMFARSAYNRYYYAAFLSVREVLSALDPNWARLPHAAYPQTIEGQVIKTIRSGRSKASKFGDFELEAQCQRALAAAKQLAKLMRDSSAVRVVADYEPAVPVNFVSSGRFNLGGVEITSAHQWPGQARTWAEAIALAWRQVNA